MSFVKFIHALGEPIINSWATNAETAYRSLVDDERAAYIFEQSLAIRYLYLAYGGALPVLIRNHSCKILEHARCLIEQKDAMLRDPGVQRSGFILSTFCKIVSAIEKLVNGQPIENSAEIYQEVIRCTQNDVRYPRVIVNTPVCLAFYDTLLKYLNPTLHRNGFSTNQALCLPSICLVGQTIVFNYDATFTNYNLSKQLANNLLAVQIVPNTFFEFVSGFSWSDFQNDGVMRLVGLLSTYSLDLDTSWLYQNYEDSPRVLDNPRTKFGLMRNVRRTSNEAKIFTILKRFVHHFNSYIETPFDALEISSEVSFRRLFISLLIALRRQYHLVFNDNDISVLSTVMGKGENGIQAYLNTSNNNVSNEAIKEFNGSVFSEFPELHLGNRVRFGSERSDESFSYRDIATQKENLKEMYLHDASITGPAPLRDAKNDVDDSDTKSAASKDLDQTLDEMPDDATASDSNDSKGLTDGGNENGDVGATGDDDTSGTKSDGDKDESTNDEGENNTSDADADEKSDTKRDKISMRKVPDLPDVSDKQGVKLELASSDTTDTVFYRVELKSYIDSILDNPPRTISQQKIQVLRKIEALWLNILTPQCIYDLINSVIKLPEMYRIHKGKKS